MLVYSEQRFIPTDLNVVVLQDTMGNYLYVHRMLYDNAVILSNNYNGDYKALAAKVSPTGDIPENRTDVDFFFQHVPAPINILAPFLLLCVEPFEMLEDAIGAIHVMSNTFDFKKLPDIPKEVRINAMTFSMSITEEYQLSWDLFFTKCIPYSEDLLLNRSVPQAAPAPTVASAPTEKPKSVNGIVAEEDLDPNGTYLTMPDGSFLDFNFDPKEFFGEDFDPDAVDRDPPVTSEPEPVKEESVETQVKSEAPPAKASGMDFLKSLR